MDGRWEGDDVELKICVYSVNKYHDAKEVSGCLKRNYTKHVLHNLDCNKVTLCQRPSRLFSLTERFTTGWWLVLLAERSKTQHTEVCVCESDLSRGREAYDKHAVTSEEGDNLGVEGKTTGLLPSRTQECGSGRIPARVFLCACVYSFQTGILNPHGLWLHLSRPGTKRERVERGLGILRYHIHFLPPSPRLCSAPTCTQGETHTRPWCCISLRLEELWEGQTGEPCRKMPGS